MFREAFLCADPDDCLVDGTGAAAKNTHGGMGLGL
jgi:hypothetical protein